MYFQCSLKKSFFILPVIPTNLMLQEGINMLVSKLHFSFQSFRELQNLWVLHLFLFFPIFFCPSVLLLPLCLVLLTFHKPNVLVNSVPFPHKSLKYLSYKSSFFLILFLKRVLNILKTMCIQAIIKSLWKLKINH